MSRHIIHVDMDAFFASVEQRDNPRLKGRPVIIFHPPEHRSVVATASYEARAYGVRSAMPLALARQKCPHGLYVPGNNIKYAQASVQVMAICRRYTPLVEYYSIDEAFLDVTGCERLFGPAPQIAGRMKEDILREVGLTCSVGVAPNKLLAKMASEMQKPNGLTVITPDQVPAILEPLPIRDLFYVGPQTEKKLRDMGITTIGSLALLPARILRQRFGLFGLMLHQFARGIDDAPVDPDGREAKSVGHERTLLQDINDPSEVRGHLLQLSEMVSRRLRREGQKGRTVTLKLRAANFTTITRAQTLRAYTDAEKDIFPAAWDLLQKHWDQGFLRLIGLSVSHLKNKKEVGEQLTLFSNPNHSKLLATLDRLRDKYGNKIIMRGSLCRPANPFLKKEGHVSYNEKKMQ